jgi:hypothetical protein
MTFPNDQQEPAPLTYRMKTTLCGNPTQDDNSKNRSRISKSRRLRAHRSRRIPPLCDLSGMMTKMMEVVSVAAIGWN